MGFVIKGSGVKAQYDTGAVRDVRVSKGRYDLISPLALKRIAVHLEKGAIKYSARNWEQGFPFTRMLDSAKRHLEQYHEGDRDEDHLAAACFNAMAMMHFEEMIARGLLSEALNDMPNYIKGRGNDGEEGSL